MHSGEFADKWTEEDVKKLMVLLSLYQTEDPTFIHFHPGAWSKYINPSISVMASRWMPFITCPAPVDTCHKCWMLGGPVKLAIGKLKADSSDSDWFTFSMFS